MQVGLQAPTHTYKTPIDKHHHMYFEVNEVTAGEFERLFIQKDLGIDLELFLKDILNLKG